MADMFAKHVNSEQLDWDVILIFVTSPYKQAPHHIFLGLEPCTTLDIILLYRPKPSELSPITEIVEHAKECHQLACSFTSNGFFFCFWGVAGRKNNNMPLRDMTLAERAEREQLAPETKFFCLFSTPIFRVDRSMDTGAGFGIGGEVHVPVASSWGRRGSTRVAYVRKSAGLV